MAISRVLQNVKGSRDGGGGGEALWLDDSLIVALEEEVCNWDIKRLIMEVIKSLCNALAGIWRHISVAISTKWCRRSAKSDLVAGLIPASFKSLVWDRSGSALNEKLLAADDPRNDWAAPAAPRPLGAGGRSGWGGVTTTAVLCNKWCWWWSSRMLFIKSSVTSSLGSPLSLADDVVANWLANVTEEWYPIEVFGRPFCRSSLSILKVKKAKNTTPINSIHAKHYIYEYDFHH